jgi:hypothetical protein
MRFIGSGFRLELRGICLQPHDSCSITSITLPALEPGCNLWKNNVVELF